MVADQKTFPTPQARAAGVEQYRKTVLCAADDTTLRRFIEKMSDYSNISPLMPTEIEYYTPEGAEKARRLLRDSQWSSTIAHTEHKHSAACRDEKKSLTCREATDTKKFYGDGPIPIFRISAIKSGEAPVVAPPAPFEMPISPGGPESDERNSTAPEGEAKKQ